MFKCIIISILILFIITGYSHSNENDTSEGDITQVQDLGEGEYMTESGKIIQTTDLGGGEYITDSGELLQETDPSGDELLTSDDKRLDIIE